MNLRHWLLPFVSLNDWPGPDIMASERVNTQMQKFFVMNGAKPIHQSMRLMVFILEICLSQ